MEPTDLTIEILKDIRGEIRSTREGLSQRIDALAEGQVRLATEVVGVANAVHQLSDLLREDRALRARVDDHDERIARLESRAG